MSSWKWILPVLFVILPDMSYSDHTMCPCEALQGVPLNAHPQIVFNNADWVARVEIIGIFVTKKINITGGFFRDRVYTVNVVEVFKGSELMHGKSKTAIRTDGKISPCGVLDLRKNHTYLLAGHQDGNRFWIDECSRSLISKWEDVSLHQRISLKGRYEENIDCQNDCKMEIAIDPERDSEKYGFQLMCYFKYSTCIEKKHKNGGCKCGWKFGFRFFMCMIGCDE